MRSVYSVFSLAPANAKKNTIHIGQLYFCLVPYLHFRVRSNFHFFLVERTFLGMQYIWPFMVADDGGRYFVTASFVNPGTPIS